MNEPLSELRVFSGRGNPDLAKRICEHLSIQLGQAESETFPDGETFVRLHEDVRGRDCFIVQPTSRPVNENLVELLVFIDCLRRASARRITAVLPYFAYARQDRKDEGRTPISAKLVSNLITTAGAHRVLTIDLHAPQIQGFFDIPVDHLTAEPIFAPYFRNGADRPDNVVFVSPDVGNVKRARFYAQRMGCDLAIIDKRRLDGSKAVVENIIGDVEGRNIIMVDDMIATGGTVCEAARLCKERGARSVRAAATHGVLCGPAFERLSKSPLDELLVTDSFRIDPDAARLPMLKILTCAPLLGDAIQRIHRNQSVSSLFLKS